MPKTPLFECLMKKLKMKKLKMKSNPIERSNILKRENQTQAIEYTNE